jgi:hypothetical protein
MKKLILAIAVVALIASPALAVDWNFYGSARVITWYSSTDLGDGTTVVGGDDDSDDSIAWGSNGHDNSRFGARVKAENVSGRVEIQLKASPGGDPGGDITVEDRLIYGEWKFGAGKLLVGKAYTPVSQFVSGQAYDEDIGLLSIGAAYGQRIAGLQLSFGGLTVALLEPNSTLLGGMTLGDVDTYLPKIEASYAMSLDMFNFAVMGGYQTYTIDDGGLAGRDGNVDVDSYLVGGNVGVNFGPAYVKGAVSYGENIANAAWDIPGLYTAGAFAAWDGTDGTDDVTTLQWALVGGFKFTDQVTFEAGFGWRNDDPDANGLDDQTLWSTYGQAVISMAPGVWIIPEIGYQDYGDLQNDDDAGAKFYAGAKWQIDF